jgi:hypothetical protein
MRFMVLVKADERSEAGEMPSEALILEMGRFNEQLVKAGVMLAADGLQPSSKGARIKVGANGKRTVVDGPFAETKELIAGYWMIQTKSKAEAIEWFMRCPIEVEIRQVFDTADFEPVIKTEEGRALLESEREFRRRTNT